MTRNANDARLLTPGPLTTSQETKEVMLHDWGSRDRSEERRVGKECER